MTFRLNGTDVTLSVPPETTLLAALRDHLRLTGTKVGCERGECGSCTVHRDGRAVYSCLLLAVECDGGRIETIESLPDAHPIVTALVAEDALQCGYCTPGQAMAIRALLERTPDPTDDEILEGLSGNLCRCGAYHGLIRAVRRAADELRAATPRGASTGRGAAGKRTRTGRR